MEAISNTFAKVVGVSLLALLCAPVELLAQNSWINTQPGSWSDNSVWSGGGVPVVGGSNDYTITFSGSMTGYSTVDLGFPNFTLNQLQFAGTAPLFLQGSNLWFSTASDGSTLPQVLQNSAADVSLGNGLVLNSTTLFAGSGPGLLTVNGSMTGVGGLVKTGSFTMVLSGYNSYGGGTRVSEGTLVLSNSLLSSAVTLTNGSTLVAMTVAGGASGLMGEYYTNGSPNAANFNSQAALAGHLAGMTPTQLYLGSTGSTNFDFGGFNIGENGYWFPPPYNAGANFFEVRWQGAFMAPTNGSYYFDTRSDDGSMLWIDGRQVVNNNASQAPTTHGGFINLSAGLHSIVIGFYQGNGGYGMSADVSVPGSGTTNLLPNWMLSSSVSRIGSLSGSADSSLVLSNGFLMVDQSATSTFAGTITGSGSLALVNSGRLVLTGTNSFSGGLFLNNGTLYVTNDLALGAVGNLLAMAGGTLEVSNNVSLNRPVTVNGTGGIFNVDSGSILTITNAITGAGGLTKAGEGLLILTGSNRYSGLTLVQGNGSGSLLPGLVLSNTTGAAIAGNVQIGNISQGGTGRAMLQMGASNQFAGSSVISFDAADNNRNAYLKLMGRNQLVGGISDTTGQGVIENTEAEGGYGNSVLTVSNTANYGFNGYFRNGGSGTLGLTKDGSGTLTLSGGNINYSGPTLIRNGTLDFYGIANNNSAISNNATVLFDTAGNLVTQSGVITGSGALVKSGANALLLTANNGYSGNTIVTAGAVRAVDGAGLSTASLLVLSGGVFETSSDFSRALGNGSGQVRIGGSGGFSAYSTTGPVNFNLGGAGATLQLGGSAFNLTNLLLNGVTANTNLTLLNGLDLNGSNLTVTVQTNVATVSGKVIDTAGGGILTKNGPGVLALTNTNTYNGGTVVSAGALRADDGVGLPTASALTLNGGVIELSAGFTRNVGTGAGQVQIIGNGGFSAFGSGPVTVNLGGAAATLQLSSPGLNLTNLILNYTSANTNITLANGIDLNGTNLTVTVGTNVATINGAIGNSAGTAALIKSGAGTLVLAGNNSYNGGTILTAGELSVGSEVNFGGAVSTLSFSGGLLRVTGTSITNLDSHTVNWGSFNGGFDLVSAGNTFTVTNSIGGAGSVTKAGAGRLILENANSYSGGTIINGGTLFITNDFNLGASGGGLTFGDGGTLETTNNFTLNNRSVRLNTGGGTFDVAAGSVLVVTNGLSGLGGLTKSGSGTLVLAGGNAYDGPTVARAGTLVLSNGILNSALSLSNGTTVILAPGSSQGLVGEYFNLSTQPNAANFASQQALAAHLAGLTPTLVYPGSPTSTNFDFQSSGSGFPPPYLTYPSNNNFEGRWQGVFMAPTNGVYTFGTASDDGSMLWIDGNTVVTNNFFQGVNERYGSTNLTAGPHSIVIAFFQGGGGYGLWADVSLPGSGTTNRLPNWMLSSMMIGSLDGEAGSTLVISNSTVMINQLSNGTFAGTITGTGSLALANVGTLTLSGNNDYSGGTYLDGGRLSIGSDANIGGAASAITFNGGILQVTGTTLTNLDSHVVNWSNFVGGFGISNPANVFTVTNQIGGVGGMIMDGAGTLVLSGSNSYSGGTIINGGTLFITNDFNLGAASGRLTFGGGTLETTNNLTLPNRLVTLSAGGGTFKVDGGSILTLTNPIYGTGSLTKSGSGQLTLGGYNPYSGGTLVNGGTLVVSNSLLNGAVNLTNGSTLVAMTTAGGTQGLMGEYYTTIGGAGMTPMNCA